MSNRHDVYQAEKDAAEKALYEAIQPARKRHDERVNAAHDLWKKQTEQFTKVHDAECAAACAEFDEAHKVVEAEFKARIQAAQDKFHSEAPL